MKSNYYYNNDNFMIHVKDCVNIEIASKSTRK